MAFQWLVYRPFPVKVYDLVHRFGSLEMHGKMYGLEEFPAEQVVALGTPGVTLLLRAILLIVDNKISNRRTMTDNEILRVLQME